MRKNWLYLILASVIVIAPYSADAQKNQKVKYRSKAFDPKSRMSNDKKLEWADNLYSEGSYFNAIDYYQQLKQADERNPYITYQLAECYRATRDYVPAAHYYVEVKNLSKKSYPYATYLAGMMMKQQCEYQQAIDLFNEFLTDNKKNPVRTAGTGVEEIDNNPTRTLDQKMMKEYKKRAKREIEGCEMAIKSIKEPEAFTLVNAGPNINSAYNELSPYPLGDTALLFATVKNDKVNEEYSKKKNPVISPLQHFMYSHKQPGVVDSFQWPLPFYDGQFNDAGFHTANGCWNPGGTKFYFSKCNTVRITVGRFDSVKTLCDVYMSRFGAKNWETPMLLDIGDPGTNTMPYVAKVGKKEVLFFSSNRVLQSRGGFDLWYSIIDPRDGTASRPQNCGKIVNTVGDEISPYYDSRTQKLYFSSNGQKSFGGFDVYSAEGGPSRYRNLRNLGFPINTCADEMYFILDPIPNGKEDGYVVSNRIGSFALKNPTCCNDIWRIQAEPKLVVMGKVVSRKNNELIGESVVKMIDEKGDLITYNSEDGKFLINMSRTHAYVLTADKAGYTSSRASVSTMDVKRSDPNDTVVVTIFLDTVRSSFSVSNIYYDYNMATLRPESVAALDSVVHFMQDNPSISVEIYSYTDSKGKDDYNLALSQRRAQAVLDYLEKSGVERGRMTARGFGNKNSVAPNSVGGKDNPEGRQMNRRTEFRIVTDVPTRRVLYNSALPGTMDQQERNLRVEPLGDDDAPKAGGKAPVDDDE